MQINFKMEESKGCHHYCRFCGELYQELLVCKWDLEEFLQSNNFKKEHISQIKSINWQSDALPKTVCFDCYYNIRNIFEFFDKVETLQSELAQKCKKIKLPSVSNIKNQLGQKFYNKQIPSVSDVKFKTEVTDSNISDNDSNSDGIENDNDTSSQEPVLLEKAVNTEMQKKIKLEIEESLKLEIEESPETVIGDVIEIETQKGDECSDNQTGIATRKNLTFPKVFQIKNRKLINKLKSGNCKLIPIEHLVKAAPEESGGIIGKMLKKKPGDIKKIVMKNPALATNYKKNEEINALVRKPKFINITPHPTKYFAGENKQKEETACSCVEIEVPKYQDLSWFKYSWFCLHCDMKLPTMSSVRVHSRTRHSTCFGFKCKDCEQQFNRFFVFVEHARCHYSSLRLYCPFCDIKFKTVTDCSAHTATHYKTSFICEMCGEMYGSESALFLHLLDTKEHVLENDETAVINVELEVGRHSWKKYKWICQDCGISAPNVKALKAHTQEYHKKCFSIKCIDCSTYMKDYKMFMEHVVLHRSFLSDYCFQCDVNLQDDPRHELSHNSQDVCPKCGECFQDDDSYESHLMANDVTRDNHDLYLVKACDVCFQTFQNLKVYMKHRVEHDLPTFDCTLCPEKFLNRNDLKSHISEKHSDRFDRHKVHCEICDKRFLNSYMYNRHVKTHEKKICHECGKSFMTSAAYKKHMIKHSGEKPYPCSECDKTFADTGNRRKHMARIHKTPRQVKGWFPAEYEGYPLTDT